MKLGFHGATSMTSDLETDVAASAGAGFKALELWAAKVDRFLADHSQSELQTLFEDKGGAPMSLNSIEFIAFRGDEYAHIRSRCRDLCEIAKLDPARIFAFHLDDLKDVPKEEISDARRLLPGLGVVPLDEICKRLKGIGYDGACSVELFRPEYWEWDPVQLAVKVRETATKVLSPYFELE